ncbi:hypothetical protein BKA65DRAFT_584537 [Rhexocercosporidium sp. MPI-PUGE-AT-0058]|nr:hypothetical protein BKA65DRAFT_584537 [Rhexocercosporidium sp. MPI-PUGE-AT-0058]
MAVLTATYKEIGLSDDNYSDTGEDLGRKIPQSKWPRASTIILSMTTLIFGLQALYLSTRLAGTCLNQTFQNGYTTEWDPAKASIQLQQVTYTSAFRYNETSQGYYREYEPTAPQYVGTPNKDIDKAWGELLSGQYLVLSEEEAHELENPVPIKGFYLAEVEVMHSLHCLNAIRKAVDKEYYAEHDEHHLPEGLRRIHIEHCFEQLRQNIQCASDLTPVPLRPFGDELHANLIGTPQVHTCRNWEVFRKWYTDRGLEHGRVNGGGT